MEPLIRARPCPESVYHMSGNSLGSGLFFALTCMFEQYLWIVPFLSSLFPRPQSCKCFCECSSDPAQGVLELLGQQLSRCGPEHLGQSSVSCTPCKECPSPALPWTALFLAFGVGVIVGLLVAWRLYVVFLQSPVREEGGPRAGPDSRAVSDRARLVTTVANPLPHQAPALQELLRSGPSTPAVKRRPSTVA